MNNTTLMQQKIIDRIEEFCRVLRTHYESFAIDSHRDAIDKADEGDSYSVNYHKTCIEKLSMGEDVDEYIYEKGRKYAKVIHITQPSGQRSAHAFVDLNTGDVFKSASWKSPAKGIRYNLLEDSSREEMYRRADWSGQYLYK